MNVRFQVLTAASMMFRVVFSGMMEAVRTSETSVDNHFTRQYIPEDNSEHHIYEGWFRYRILMAKVWIGNRCSIKVR
jgi:hypothetical protein